MLFQICDLPDDKTIMAGDPRFTPLAEDMGTLSIDDYKRKLQSQRKGLNADRNTIPARLDEQKKVVGTLQEINFDSLHVEHDATVEKSAICRRNSPGSAMAPSWKLNAMS